MVVEATLASATSRSSIEPTTWLSASPRTRRAIASPSICPSWRTRSAPATRSTSAAAADEAVTATGTSPSISRTVKVMLALVVSGNVDATRAASTIRAARYVPGSSSSPTITR